MESAYDSDKINKRYMQQVLLDTIIPKYSYNLIFSDALCSPVSTLLEVVVPCTEGFASHLYLSLIPGSRP